MRGFLHKINLALHETQTLLAIVASVLFIHAPALAASLDSRSVAISTAIPGATAQHAFAITVPSVAVMGSIVFEYCSNSPLNEIPCSAPAGLDVSAAILNDQTGNIGFAIDPGSTTANMLVITRPPLPGLIVPSSYVFEDIVNPSGASSTFVRIRTYGSTDGTGAHNDSGSVAFATNQPLNVDAFVPPHLTFCSGITVALDCTDASGFYINLSELSKATANTGASQYSGASNDPSGYNVTVLGVTMTSGNNTIPELSSPSPSLPGTSQFGINLRANSSPAVGQDVIGPGTATADTSYNLSNNFMFQPGTSLSSSSLSTEFNLFTVSYLVNVSANQAPGIYNTTLTFLATAAF